MDIQREDIEFPVDKVTCRAWLYRPSSAGNKLNPCIVMAHGFGGTRDAGLEPYAIKFARAGYVVMIFDYRHFGASDGEPRQLLSIGRQLEDWDSAINCVRSLPGIDPARIALWGTSFSGGHVIVAAARDGKIAAISAQAPMVDALESTWHFLHTAGFINFIKSGSLGLLDLLKAMTGMPPLYVPLVGSPAEHAALCSADAVEGYTAITPPDWRNEICARYALSISHYRPIRYATRLSCPALIQVCTQDQLVSTGASLKAVQIIGAKAELKQYDCGHFDIYLGEYFEQASNDQLDFFSRVLNP